MELPSRRYVATALSLFAVSSILTILAESLPSGNKTINHHEAKLAVDCQVGPLIDSYDFLNTRRKLGYSSITALVMNGFETTTITWTPLNTEDIYRTAAAGDLVSLFNLTLVRGRPELIHQFHDSIVRTGQFDDHGNHVNNSSAMTLQCTTAHSGSGEDDRGSL